MNSEESSFLPHFITEEIYKVDDVYTPEVDAVSAKVDDVASPEVASDQTEEVKEPVEKYKSTPEIKLQKEGNNNKGIIILVNYTNGIPEDEKDFLIKILSAVKLSVTDIAIIDLGINNTPEHYSLVSKLNCNKLIAFGTENSLLFPDNLPMYELTPHNSIQIIKSHSLNEVAKDTAKKKLLWAQLQTAFQS